MKKLVSASAIMLALAFKPVVAQFVEYLPPECRSDRRPVALVDCLRNQQDVLQAVADYHELLAHIERTKAERAATTAPGAATPNPEPDNASARVQWFDDNLQVYAVTGRPGDLTAHARLDGREFRLREGDAVRLAQVTKVHSRGIELQVSGQAVSIGLSGRLTRPGAASNEN